MRLFIKSLTAGVALASTVSMSADLQVGIEKSSKTNLPVVTSAFEPLTNAIRTGGAIKDLRLSIDGVDGILASFASQSPALLLVHRHASNAIRASGDYTAIATFEMTTSRPLTLLSSKTSGIDTGKELAGKRVIVGKQGGYVSAATKLWLAKEGVESSTVNFKYVRYADLKLSMLQGGLADAAIATDKDTIEAWKSAGGLVTQIGGYPNKYLLAHSSVNAETKAKLKKMFEAGSISAPTTAALTNAGLRSVASTSAQ